MRPTQPQNERGSINMGDTDRPDPATTAPTGPASGTTSGTTASTAAPSSPTSGTTDKAGPTKADPAHKAATAIAAHRARTAATGGLGPRASLIFCLVLTLLLGSLSLLVMYPAAQHLRSLQNGEQAEATLHTAGSCMIGNCRVRFEADGRTVIADLPVGSGGGKSSVGTRLTVRHQADDPSVAARNQDVGGGGAAVFTVLFGVSALFFLALALAAAIHLTRQRQKPTA
ncbi:hypothetical protein MTQ01_00195 [Streptomyces sp. XM4193]|uniref:DUF3592 domain-containing protein n=1 Tax=Streptomyces sp. XM4193 TaxID=2929782 RepID=UPI001FF7570B|nr:DUF3592 domain-containing protein [Streptomyces sp. XM4193]MCK1794474.1 hypothetical protein [Streptomyces sp. XM4193]